MKLLSASLLLALLACAPKQEIANKYRVIAFGDSFTARNPTWAAYVAEGINRGLLNTAKDSSRLASINQLPQMLTYPYEPNDIVVMLIGYNDVAVYQKDPAGLVLFKQELAQMVAFYKSLGNQVYIGTACNVPAYYDATYGLDTSDRPLYVQAIKDAVAAGNAPNLHLVDVNAVWVPDVGTTLLVDQHPSAYGHSVIASVFLGVIK